MGIWMGLNVKIRGMKFLSSFVAGGGEIVLSCSESRSSNNWWMKQWIKNVVGAEVDDCEQADIGFNNHCRMQMPPENFEEETPIWWFLQCDVAFDAHLVIVKSPPRQSSVNEASHGRGYTDLMKHLIKRLYVHITKELLTPARVLFLSMLSWKVSQIILLEYTSAGDTTM